MEATTMGMTDAQKAAFKPAAELKTGVSKNTVGVSPAAADAGRAALAKRGTPDAAIRLGIKGGGCSGFAYHIEYDDAPARAGDLVLALDTDAKGEKATVVRFFVDKKSIIYLGGSLLDWEKTLMFQGFKFKNPQEASSCGCGHSFTVR